MRATIGIDIGGTKTRLALLDERFHVLDDAKFKTQILKGAKPFMRSFDESLAALKHRATKEGVKLVAAGIGLSGTVNKGGTAMKVTPVPFLKGFPLVDYVRKKLKVPVLLGNDVHMGLYGEHKLGAAKGLKNIIGVFFGTGIGAALIIEGKLYKGTNRHAGDIGHYLVAPLGPLAGSERDGTLNDFASMSALAGKAAMMAARNNAPYLMKIVGSDVSRIRSGVLADAIEHGDHQIEEMVRSRAHMAGIALSNLVDFLNPDMVVLGGGLVEAMPAIFQKEVEAGIRHHIVDEVRGTFAVAVTKLKAFAVATGAAKMAWDTLVIPGMKS